MAQAKRDENHVTTALGWDDINSTTKPFLVDPTTGRLEITVVAINGGSPTVHDSPLSRDENRVPVAGAVSDADSDVILPLHIDAASGNLAVDLVKE